MGEMFEAGRGTAANPNWAYLWYAVAEMRGVAGARRKRMRSLGGLQPKEIEQADKLARSVVSPADSRGQPGFQGGDHAQTS